MTEEEDLGFKPTSRLEEVGDKRWKRIASIEYDDALISPSSCESGRMIS